ncbi:hypothetical protein [Actinomadura sp. HBU206391]|uniref:hypothetical protein n=1 Tax=Actinomadura sp. HBU206391 TaxID=2731692 RepID=UPI001650D464|nr:hypothetical protein [Actinomadura sp. HBU206391]MBC6456378.1 hypothetical protein [Actinomadura sp. HBU206391]
MRNKINEENDPQFPNGSTLLVWYPPCGADAHDRCTWAWLPGSILRQCCPDECYVVVKVLDFAEPGPNVPNGDAPEDLLCPACFRDSSELRPISEERWMRLRESR